MNIKNFLFLVLLFLIASLVIKAQIENKEHIINSAFGDKVELYFSFPLQDKETMLQLTRIISIDNVKNDRVIAIANKKRFDRFLDFKIPFTIELSPFELVSEEDIRMIDNIGDKSLLQWDDYPTYPAYVNMMHQFAIDYPALCSIDTIGYSVQNRLLLSARITSNVNPNSNKPEFFYTATMHGNETAGYVLMLRLIDYLLSNYGTNVRITNMLNNIIIYINPLANPDGAYYGGNNTVANAIRFNSNLVDLNRNYPDWVAGSNPDGEPWQPETIAFMEYANNRNFVMSANFHGGIELMNYPWDCTYTLTADNNWWIHVCKQYADTAQFYSPAGYFDEQVPGSQHPGVTNGAEWYIIYGGRQDYMNYYKHCRESTIELSDAYILPANQLPAHWDYNYRSFLNYIEQVMYGFRGKVTENCFGEPVKAKIELLSHDMDNSHVLSTTEYSSYYRPVYQGTYTIQVSADGYQTQTINNISINNFQTVVYDFNLIPFLPQANFVANETNSCSGYITFNNTSITGENSTFLWNFGDGNTSTEQNPAHTYNANGTYTVKLIVSNCAGQDSIIKINYVYIYDNPVALFDYNAYNLQVSFFNQSEQGQIYLWNFGDGNTSEEENPIHLYDADGEYIVNLTVTNPCGSSKYSDTIHIIFIGISSERLNNIKVYPNPASENITITSDQEIQNIQVFDIYSKLLFNNSVKSNKTEVLLGDFKGGIYFIKLFFDDTYVVHKLIVQ